MLDKNLLQETKRYRRPVLKILTLQIAAALCTVSTAYLLAKIIGAVFLHQASLPQVVPFITVLLFVMLLKPLLRWHIDTKARRLSLRVQDGLRARLLRALFARGPVALAGEKTGELIACLTDGIDALDGYFTRFLPQCAAAAIIPPLLLVACLPADWPTGLIFLLTAPLIPIFMFLIGKRAEQANAAQWKTLTKLSTRFLDLLEGMTTLKIFNQSGVQGKNVAALSEEFRATTLRVLRVAFLSAFVLELTATLSVAVIAVTVGLRLLTDRLAFEQAFFVLLLAPEFYQPLRQLGSAFHLAMSGTAAAEQIYHFFSPNPTPPTPVGSMALAANAAPSVHFENVRYAYQANREPALDGLSFTVGAGQRIALVGASGAGKSTIFHLLLKFIQPDAGEIHIGGQTLSSLAPDALHRSIAYLPQAPHIFAASAAENIGLAKNGAALPEITVAAKQANIHDFLSALPQGYETQLGEGGHPLSGGQRQRIAIARAFLQDAPLLLLDEAMTGLDAATEAQINIALEKLSYGKTMLIIAHRLAAAKRADKIVVLAAGRVAEMGTHKELLQKQGLYAALYKPDRSRP